MNNFLIHLENLCNLPGVSGSEEQISRYIIDNAPKDYNISKDNMGNLLFSRGNEINVALYAHMDEVGFIVTYIQQDGTLNFDTVGGIDISVAVGRHVLVNGIIQGVISARTYHNLTPEERKKPIKIDHLHIDIGANDYENAKSMVNIGDFVVFEPNYTISNNSVFSKAIDDRFGCAALLTLMENNINNIVYIFTVQEEIGVRGANHIANCIKSNYAIVIETTTAVDLHSIQPSQQIAKLGKGPVIPFMDNGTIYNRELYNILNLIAKENDIPIQTKTSITGGNDAAAIHKSRFAQKSIAISTPCRYLHSPTVMAEIDDMQNCLLLTKLLLEKLY